MIQFSPDSKVGSIRAFIVSRLYRFAPKFVTFKNSRSSNSRRNLNASDTDLRLLMFIVFLGGVVL